MPDSAESTKNRKPSVYILLGDDEDALRKQEQGFISKIENVEMASLNISHLNGKTDSLDELVKNINLFPFGVERRLVIVRDPLARITGKEAIERWKNVIENVPPTTALLLIFHTEYFKKAWKIYKDKSWFEKWVKEHGDFFVREYKKPTRKELDQRIAQMAKKEGCEIEPRAASELGGLFGEDTLTLRQELIKLAIYVNGQRAINVDDVHLLSAAIPEENVFDMVDAFATGDSKQALHHLRLMFANQPYVTIFAMVVRQFRLLLLTKEVMNNSGSNAVQTTLKLHPYVASKLVSQCKRFSMEKLEEIYQALYDLDGNIKRGLIQPQVGLELVFLEKTSQLSN